MQTMINDFVRCAHFRYHVRVHATKVWDFERQAFDYLLADEQYSELVRGYFSEAEAQAAVLEFEREAEEHQRTGDGTAPELVFTIHDTQQ